jgi:hypothetical protein
MNDKHMQDEDLDKLLAATRQPLLPRGFAVRLQAKLEQGEPSNVISFPGAKQKPAQARRGWISALPLAASLAVGIYLGFADTVPVLTDVLQADAGEAFLDIGIEDTESFLNGDMT